MHSGGCAARVWPHSDRHRNDHHEDAQRINQAMPSTPRDLFPAASACARNRRRFDALTVQTASDGVFMASRPSPHLGAEGIVYALPAPIVTLLAKLMIDVLSDRMVFGGYTPMIHMGALGFNHTTIPEFWTSAKYP
jgi:hypothetical protein